MPRQDFFCKLSNRHVRRRWHTHTHTHPEVISETGGAAMSNSLSAVATSKILREDSTVKILIVGQAK